MIATIALWITAGITALLLVNVARSDRRIDRLEHRVAVLSSAFVITTNKYGTEVITALKVPAITSGENTAFDGHRPYVVAPAHLSSQAVVSAANAVVYVSSAHLNAATANAAIVGRVSSLLATLNTANSTSGVIQTSLGDGQ